MKIRVAKYMFHLHDLLFGAVLRLLGVVETVSDYTIYSYGATFYTDLHYDKKGE